MYMYVYNTCAVYHIEITVCVIDVELWFQTYGGEGGEDLRS